MKRTYQPRLPNANAPTASWFAPKPAVVAQYWLPVAPKAANAWLYNLNYGFSKQYRLLKTDDFHPFLR